MPTSPSINRCMPLSQSSANNSLECPRSVEKDYGNKSDSEVRKSIKRNLQKSHSFSRKFRQILIHPQKSSRRRYTFSGGQESKIVFKKRRRLSSIAWPTRFLLGGNRTDPLNLRSLEDETINQQLNAFSPASSPMPVPARRTQVQVFIPSNINDPLNLNSGEEIELNLLKARKRRRHRKSRREEHENQVDLKDVSPINELPSLKLNSELQDTSQSPKYENGLVEKKDISIGESLVEKICSTSIEDLTNKISTPDSVTKKDEASSLQKKIFKRRRSKSRIQRNDTIRFRANAEKFCYGNHISSQSSWTANNSDTDPRITFFSLSLFKNKDVLDIGCNTGKLTLLIAKLFEARKMTGLDIDKKLIRIAQRNVRLAHRNFTCNDMPKSMHLLYGPLAKLMLFKRRSILQYPENVSFLEANYVPPCDEYLETQKPEYDTILCLRVTKWIHLNFGDEGLKLAFKRMFAQLHIGGHLILEPQPWFTYSASKRITPAIYKTYCSLKMRPESFCDYLLSDEVGFSSCDIIGRSTNYAKGYRHDIYLLTKSYQNPHDNLINNLSPIPFHSSQWIQDSDDNFDGISEYVDTASEYSETNIET